MLIDSHCHLDKLDIAAVEGGIDALLDAAKARGVSHFLCVAVALDKFDSMYRLTAHRPEVFYSCGVHPLQSCLTFDEQELLKLASQAQVVAVGETGLDYHYAPQTKAAQLQAFECHADIALRLNKPLIVHTRKAREDTLALLKNFSDRGLTGVLHCFTEDWEMARQAIDMGFYISISGIVTFANASALREVVKKLPADALLVETDAPYLAPVPYRGKQNQPAFVREVAEFIAKLRNMPLEQLAEQTTHNFFRLFPQARQFATS